MARSSAPVSLVSLQKEASKQALRERNAQFFNPLPPKPKVAADEVAVKSNGKWSIQKKTLRNTTATILQDPGFEARVAAAKQKARVCPAAIVAPAPTTTTTTNPLAGKVIIRRPVFKLSDMLKKSKPTAPNHKPIPKSNLKLVKAGRICKAVDTIQCGHLRDDSKSRSGKKYTINRVMPQPKLWMALGPEN